MIIRINLRKKKSKNKKEFHTFNPHNISRSMNNKQIRKNIPTYRKNTPTHNNNFIYNSFTFDKNKHFKGYKKFNNLVCFSLENSFNKSLCSSLLGKSVRDPFYNASHNRNYSLRKKTSMSRMRAKDTPTRFNMQQSYINNSSMFNISSSYMRTQNIIKKNKEKRLYNVVTKNLRRNSNTYKSKRNKIKSYEKKIINIDKEINNNSSSNLLYHQYRDIAEVGLPINYNEESLINNIISESSINNKIIYNYNKLNKFNTSIILYDGFLHKVIDRKNNGFKLSKRYFQITKNCFRYYNLIENAKNENDKPLVQFDIRHIKDLQIVDYDFLKDYKIDEKDIEFVFCIYLFQNDDFFVFAVNNENFGNSVFNILTLLKNYYEDKK